MCRVTSSQVGQIRPLRFKVQKKDAPSGVEDRDNPHTAGEARSGAQSSGGGSHLRALFLDYRHVDPDHATHGDGPLAGAVRAGEVHNHTPGDLAHESVDGTEGQAGDVRAGCGAIKVMMDKGLFLEAPHRWACTAWSQLEKKALVTDQPHLSSDELKAAIKTLWTAAMTEGVIHKFAPMQKLGTNISAQAVVFTLVLTTRYRAERVPRISKSAYLSLQCLNKQKALKKMV